MSSQFPTVDEYLFSAPIISYCSQCRVSQVDQRLKQCSRCRCTKYCSVECQRKHHRLIHKSDCKQVAKLTHNLEGLMSDISSRDDLTYLWDDDFLGSWGSRSHVPSDLPSLYCQTKHELASALLALAYRSSDTIERGLEMYASSLKHFVELMRLSRHHSSQCSYQVSFILAAIGCHEAAHSMLHFRFLQGPLVRSGSKTGDWIYPKIDFYGDVESIKEKPTACLLAHFLIKLRIVAECETNETRLNVLFRETGPEGKWRDLEQVYRSIRLYLVGSDSFLLEQRRQVQLIHDELTSDTSRDSELPLKILECGPLSKHNCETLFDFTSLDTIPDELWYFVQDAFLLSPGVFNLMHELVHGS